MHNLYVRFLSFTLLEVKINPSINGFLDLMKCNIYLCSYFTERCFLFKECTWNFYKTSSGHNQNDQFFLRCPRTELFVRSWKKLYLAVAYRPFIATFLLRIFYLKAYIYFHNSHWSTVFLWNIFCQVLVFKVFYIRQRSW